MRFSSPPEGHYRAREFPATFQHYSIICHPQPGSLQGGELGDSPLACGQSHPAIPSPAPPLAESTDTDTACPALQDPFPSPVTSLGTKDMSPFSRCVCVHKPTADTDLLIPPPVSHGPCLYSGGHGWVLALHFAEALLPLTR